MKGYVRRVLYVMLFAVAVYGAYAVYSGIGKLGESLTHFSWAAFAAACGLAFGNYVLRYFKWEFYLATLAEGGLIGATCFLSILVTIMYGLWKVRSLFKDENSELALIASAFFLSLSGHAISSLFAHLAYQRYFWLLLALSSAAIRIIYSSSGTAALEELSVPQDRDSGNAVLHLEAEDAYSE